MRIAITDVAVGFEKLGPGESLLGMATTRYRITQDYKLAMKVAFMNRNSTEHIVQEYWMADQKRGFANPFARLGSARPGGGGAFAELMARTAEATARMGKGIPVKTLTTTTSTNDKGEKSTNVATMEVTELHAGTVDDAMLVPPADYQVMDMGAQTKAMAEQMQQAKAAQAAQAAQAGEPADSAKPESGPSAKEAAKEAALQGLRKRTTEQAAKRQRSTGQAPVKPPAPAADAGPEPEAKQAEVEEPVAVAAAATEEEDEEKARRGLWPRFIAASLVVIVLMATATSIWWSTPWGRGRGSSLTMARPASLRSPAARR
jgi:hypothetical protein